jgi:hypothetical protein
MLQCHPDLPIQSLECPKRGQKPEKLPFLRRTTSPFSTEKEKSSFLKMNEQSGNVYENKGSVFHSQPKSGNVIENKGRYALKAGMLLKTNDLDCMSWVVAGGRTCSRFQVSGFRG